MLNLILIVSVVVGGWTVPVPQGDQQPPTTEGRLRDVIQGRRGKRADTEPRKGFLDNIRENKQERKADRGERQEVRKERRQQRRGRILRFLLLVCGILVALIILIGLLKRG